MPFDNNEAERDLRMMKTRQKISGCFRSLEWSNRFAKIRSVIASAKKKAVNVYEMLQLMLTDTGNAENYSSAPEWLLNNGHYELAVSLLELGANPNDQASSFTPLQILTWVRKPRRGDSIDGAPPPTITGSTNAFELVDALIAHDADINAKLEGGSTRANSLGRPGSTPFLLASQTADLPLMRHYLKYGADPQIPNNQNRTPLMAAAGIGIGPEADEASSENEAVAATKLLLELGSDPN